MTRITDEQLIQRSKAAQLKIVEAKATLWVAAGFVAMLLAVGVVVALIAFGFKLMLG